MANHKKTSQRNLETEKEERFDTSRRKFLRNTGIAAGGVVGGAVLGGLLNNPFKSQESKTTTAVQETKPAVNYSQALMFFRPEQFDIVQAASERIFPADENGPGAIDLLVPYFIDHQLAGSWGVNAKDYTSGPFYQGEATQGYQGNLNRQEIFEIGLRGLQQYSLDNYDNPFKDLSAEEQEDVLIEFLEGNVELKGITSAYFFNVLRSVTIEGVYSDPLYGGNADMEGWKMKNFPGHQMSYKDMIDSEEFIEMEPQSLNAQHKH